MTKKATCCVKACRQNCSCVQFSCTALPLLLSRNVFLCAYFERATQEFSLKDASLGRREKGDMSPSVPDSQTPPACACVCSLRTGECARACARHATGKNVQGGGGTHDKVGPASSRPEVKQGRREVLRKKGQKGKRVISFVGMITAAAVSVSAVYSLYTLIKVRQLDTRTHTSAQTYTYTCLSQAPRLQDGGFQWSCSPSAYGEKSF